MATVKQYTKKNGEKAYMFNAYLGIDEKTGKQKRTTRRGFKTVKEAKIAASRIELGVEQETKKAKIVPTFEEVYGDWLEEYRKLVKSSTLINTEAIFKNHIIPEFGDTAIDKITLQDCQKFMNDLSDKIQTFGKTMNYIGSVFDYAMRVELITRNPVKLIKKPPKKMSLKVEEDLNFYDKEQLKLFLKYAEKGTNYRAYVFFRLAAFTGARKSEILALQWSDIDFEAKILTINKSLSKTREGYIISTTKNSSSVRKISLDENTLEIIKKFYHDESLDSLIFKSESNGILPITKPRKWLIRIQDNIDKDLDQPLKRITTHGFRHTHASLLFEAGAGIKEVQMRLGHADIQTTMNVYTHVTNHAREQLAEKFNTYINF
ncbi:tyrosine-type recombinase/integrase [Enterococcus italicus]|uniref:site-specific integrase n=1 Tax=Enterococcus italicus TaxID=246144 RepID=UPI003F47A6C3